MPLATKRLLSGGSSDYGILLTWFVAFVWGRTWVVRLHRRWFTLSDEYFDALHYGLMGLYKLGIFLFVLVPYLVLEFANPS